MIGTKEAKAWAEEWDAATHLGKIDLCQRAKVSYQLGKDFRCACRSQDVKTDYKLPPDSTWEEQIEIFKKMDKLVAFHQKVPHEISIHIPTNLPIAVTNVADMHIGAPGVDYDSLQGDCKSIEAELGLHCIIGGDGYHNIIQSSKVGSSHNQIPISPQKGLYVSILKFLKAKILCIGVGQHNYWTTLLEGEDWDGELARRLKLIYTKHNAVINLRVGNMVYQIVRLHKSRYRSSFNLTHTCKQNQRMDFPNARVVVVEDQHVGDCEQYRYNDNECVAMRTGTYAVYDDWALQNGFFGSHICNPTVILYPNEDKLVGFKQMEDAIIYLRAVRG